MLDQLLKFHKAYTLSVSGKKLYDRPIYAAGASKNQTKNNCI